jgi:hypothetical protein
MHETNPLLETLYLTIGWKVGKLMVRAPLVVGKLLESRWKAGWKVPRDRAPVLAAVIATPVLRPDAGRAPNRRRDGQRSTVALTAGLARTGRCALAVAACPHRPGAPLAASPARPGVTVTGPLRGAERGTWLVDHFGIPSCYACKASPRSPALRRSHLHDPPPRPRGRLVPCPSSLTRSSGRGARTAAATASRCPGAPARAGCSRPRRAA